MELWVRSQDKECLMKIDRIDISDNNIIMANGFEIWLGAYKTKERALEVLEEIQGKIAQNECLKSMISKLSNVKGEEEKIGKLFKEMIYEMPKE